MTTKEFIEKYEALADKDKEQFLIEAKTVDYIPYEKKVAHCEKIVKTSTTNAEGKFWSNTPLQYVLFSLTLVDLYTDITIDFDNTLAEFNLLNEKRVIENIRYIIPSREMTEFETILKMVIDDQLENLRSLAGYMDNLSEVFDIAFKEALKNFSNIEE